MRTGVERETMMTKEKEVVVKASKGRVRGSLEMSIVSIDTFVLFISFFFVLSNILLYYCVGRAFVIIVPNNEIKLSSEV